MAVSHETVVFDVHDAKVYPMQSDPANAAPTYGAAIDVPGIASVSMDPNLATAELKGDARVMARKGRVDRVNASATYGKLSLDVLKTIMGGVTADAEAYADYVLSGDNSLPYFKFAAVISDLDLGIGDLHMTLYKCNLTGGTLLSGSTDEFGQPEMQLEAIPAFGTLPAVTGTPGSPAVVNPLIKISLLQSRTPLPA